MTYRHTQTGVALLALLGVGGLVCLGLLASVGWHPVGIAALGVLAVAAVLFGSLTVAIGDGWLECRFGPGLIRKRFALADIRAASVVCNPWYYGWGIHWTPHGWLYNVSGLEAVEIVLASGKKARIGSDEPDKLADTLRQSIPATKA